MKETNDNFIMLPTVDFCFKELMMNPKVRTGFIAALLDLHPSEVQETDLLGFQDPVLFEQDVCRTAAPGRIL